MKISDREVIVYNGVRRDLVALAEADGRLQMTIDRLGDRVDRIERRLELREINQTTR